MTPREQEIQRRIALSETRVTKAVFPPTTNHHNTLFGGTALAWMDEVSFIAATRFCRLPLVTVSSDRIDFKHAIPAGSIVELIGRVIKVGNTSLRWKSRSSSRGCTRKGASGRSAAVSASLPSMISKSPCRCCRASLNETSQGRRLTFRLACDRSILCRLRLPKLWPGGASLTRMLSKRSSPMELGRLTLNEPSLFSVERSLPVS